jgi:alkylation response protein AidB-like acyl-CoA dehydrogenase
MDFGFSDEQLMIRDVARRIAQEKIAPSAEHFLWKISVFWEKTA